MRINTANDRFLLKRKRVRVGSLDNTDGVDVVVHYGDTMGAENMLMEM